MDVPILVMNRQIFSAADTSTDLVSEVLEVREVIGYAVHAIWTDTSDGILYVEAGNDGINFVPVTQITVDGTPGQFLLNVEREHYVFIRLNYVWSSGTGTLTAYVSAKRN